MTDERRSDDRTTGQDCLDPARPRVVRFRLRAPGPELLASCSRLMAATSPKTSVDHKVSRDALSLPVAPVHEANDVNHSGSVPSTYGQTQTSHGDVIPSHVGQPAAQTFPFSRKSALSKSKFLDGSRGTKAPSVPGRLARSVRSRVDLWAASGLSLAWSASAASVYISSVGSLQAVAALPPLEVSLLCATLIGPVLFIWVLLAFYRRNSLLCEEAARMREQVAALSYPATHAEQHVARISDSLRAQTTELSEATWAAAHQATTIRETIGAETRHLEKVISTIDERAFPVLERTAVHIHQLSELIDKVSGTTTAFDAALSHHYSNLAEATQRTELASSELTASLTRQCEQVQSLGGEIESRNTVVEDLVTRQEALLTSAREAADLFNHAVTALMVGAAKASHGLTKRAEAIDGSIASMTDRVQTLTESTAGTLGQFEVLGQRLDEQSARLRTHHHDITEMAQVTTRDLEAASTTALGDFNTLRDATTDALEGIHTAAAALRDTATHTEAVRRLLHTQTKELEDTVQRMGDGIRSAGVMCSEHADQMTQSTERSTERIHHLVDLLSRNSVEITRTTARSVVEIETVNEAMKRGALAAVEVSREICDATKSVAAESDHAVSRVGAATDAMAHGVDAIESAGQAFGDEAARISEAANATIVTIRTLAADLSRETHRFGETSDTSLQRAEDVRTALSATIASFEAGIDGGVERVNAAGSSLTKGSQEFMTMARSTVEVLNGSGGALRAQVDALGKATDEASERLQNVTRSLGESSDLVARVGTTVTDRANRAGEEFSRRASELSAAAEEAKDKAQELLMARQEVDVQKFLTETSYVIERLQSTAVDITRLFNPSVEADLWKRFYKGEQNVFLHYAARTITRSQSQAIKKLYTESREFRQYAGRYITEFEALLKGARANDRGDVLTAIFTSSDMGRLYVVLARSLGRMGGE